MSHSSSEVSWLELVVALFIAKEVDNCGDNSISSATTGYESSDELLKHVLGDHGLKKKLILRLMMMTNRLLSFSKLQTTVTYITFI